MISKIAFVMMAVLLSASAFASDNLSRRFQWQPAGDKFPARETTFDVFGTWRVAEHRDFSDGKLGFGIGADYFFNRYVGLSSDTHLEHFGFPQHVNFSIIGRYPIEKWSLAPYLMFGGGRHFRDPSEWTLHFGGGVDFRFNRKAALFTDLRQIWPENKPDSVLWRFGVRFGF